MGLKMWAVLAPSEGCKHPFQASLLGLDMLVSSRCLFTWSSLYACLSPNFPSYEDTSHTGLEPILMTSFYLDYLCEGPVSEEGHILRY